jgi:serine/threonine-protein kinase HipA
MAEMIVREHVTIPGVQPKLSVHLERGGGTRNARFTLVGLEGGFVLKPPVERFPEMPELEHLTMRMARCFGIATAECGLIPLEDGRLSFITRRMDREGGTKRHMEDMCQLTDRLTEQKYRSSMEQVGKAVLRYSSNPLFDALRLFELTLFCFLTGNADMHLKNFSLLHIPGGDVALSPAYDLLPTALLLPEDREELALTVNGKKRRLSRPDFERFGELLKLKDKQIANALDRLSRGLPAALDMIARGFCGSETKRRFAALIHERALRAGL